MFLITADIVVEKLAYSCICSVLYSSVLSRIAVIPMLQII